MDKLQKNDIEHILGIYAPWQIDDLKVNHDSGELYLNLSMNEEKTRFGFLRAGKKSRNESISCMWQHLRVGQYLCFISASLPSDAASDSLSVKTAAFIGERDKKYTRGLTQRVMQASKQGLDEGAISMLLSVGSNVVREILQDVGEVGRDWRENFGFLPPESSPIWRSILSEEIQLKTSMMPLQLLLVRLRNKVGTQSDDRLSTNRAISDLRAFFAQYAGRLSAEFAQLGIRMPGSGDAGKMKPYLAARKKLVLPGTHHVIWHNVLTDQFDLQSSNMQLNLFLTQCKKRYRASETADDKRKQIQSLQLLFKRNAKSLLPELQLLTAIVRGKAISVGSAVLPSIDHVVWHQVLKKNGLLESDQMNFRLFFSRLKLVYHRVEDEAAGMKIKQQLREFLTKNQRTSTKEIARINELAYGEQGRQSA